MVKLRGLVTEDVTVTVVADRALVIPHCLTSLNMIWILSSLFRLMGLIGHPF